jgi:hypothetical protein
MVFVQSASELVTKDDLVGWLTLARGIAVHANRMAYATEFAKSPIPIIKAAI